MASNDGGILGKLRSWFSLRADPIQSPPVRESWRTHFLSLTPEAAGVSAAPADSAPFGVLMDVGVGRRIAYLTALIGGEAHYYLTPYEPPLITGSDTRARQAATELVLEAGRHLSEFRAATSFPLPAPDSTAIYLLTPGGVLGAARPNSRVGSLAPLCTAGNAVIDAILESDENRGRMAKLGARVDDTYLRLRNGALSATRASMGPALISNSTRMYGLLLESPSPTGGLASLAVFADGTVSGYLSGGGGILGSGQTSKKVRQAGAAFLTAGEECLTHMSPTTTFPFADPVTVRFYALTEGGVLTVALPTADIDAKRGPLYPLFVAGHAVIDAMNKR